MPVYPVSLPNRPAWPAVVAHGSKRGRVQSDPEITEKGPVVGGAGCGVIPAPRNGQFSFTVKSNLLSEYANFILQTAKQKQKEELKPIHHKNIQIVLVFNHPVCLNAAASAQPLLRESHGSAVFVGGGRGCLGAQGKSSVSGFLESRSFSSFTCLTCQP